MVAERRDGKSEDLMKEGRSVETIEETSVEMREETIGVTREEKIDEMRGQSREEMRGHSREETREGKKEETREEMRKGTRNVRLLICQCISMHYLYIETCRPILVAHALWVPISSSLNFVQSEF